MKNQEIKKLQAKEFNFFKCLKLHKHTKQEVEEIKKAMKNIRARIEALMRE